MLISMLAFSLSLFYRLNAFLYQNIAEQLSVILVEKLIVQRAVRLAVQLALQLAEKLAVQPLCKNQEAEQEEV